ncbi:DUF308 domain-containing protein [Microbacterium yannicii]|uniref:DUF308 domain-containing protein n=1 Tax=Microbacterium yannicii TaxID=671622 RepID=UPI00030D4819|nr:DUF308 domain-containing protein [Microbacterium yannicii]
MSDPQQPTSFPPQPAPYQQQPQQPAADQPQPTAGTLVQGKPARNVLGIVALAVAAVGFIFACVPGALILGWILLPIGFILGLVAVFLKGKAKWSAVTAIIVSAVGTIIGVIVFFAVVATSFNDAFGGTSAEVSTQNDTSVVEESDEPAAEEELTAAVGTRENPAPLGSTIEGAEWTVVINSVTQNAQDQIIAENQFNEAPDAGHEYILVNYTATYTGTNADGDIPAIVGVEYVTAGGVTVNSYDKLVVPPGQIDSTSTLYSGAAATGNVSFHVPTPADGVVAVRPGLVADKVFVAIQ